MGRLEARTEDLFKDLCIKKGYTLENGIVVDRQTCSVASINQRFNSASKNDTGRPGYPDFIITNKTYPGIVILAECKADNADHRQAVQEVAYYAQFLRGGYDVVLAAVSGTTEAELKITTAIIRRDGSTITGNNPNYNDSTLLTLSEYEKHIAYTKRAEENILKSLQGIKNRINWMLYAAGNLNSDKRMLIISACLLGLRDAVFRTSFRDYEAEDILNALLYAVDRVLKKYGIPDEKRRTMLANFETLKQLDVLSGYVDTDDGTDNPITYILDVIHTSSVHDALENATLNIDVMGEFYNEFITHGQDLGNAKNGFVLTPRHICSLFADLAQLDENTRVLDMCFGTGGFLVAAMQKEMLSAKGDAHKISNIKNNNICGVELDGDRFTYGCVNMILRGDGQSNMLRGDCFNKDIIEYMKAKKCMAGFINPPYALPTLELSFVENMLDCLDVGGTGIAIIPASCATNKNSAYAAVRERILSKHTLEAVLSMPDQLFYPAAGVVTCVMIFTAHKPHNSDRKTWFARCKDDGFVIDRKSKGRADINNKWDEIRKKWVDSYIDRDVIDGFSLKHAVTAKDEWSYEAYAKTNFEGITEESFKKVVKEYALFLLSQAEV